MDFKRAFSCSNSNFESSRCLTCGSLGRKLKQMGELINVYYAVIALIKPMRVDRYTLKFDDFVCWECIAILKKVAKFSKTVQMVRRNKNFIGSNLGISKEKRLHYGAIVLESVEIKTEYYDDTVERKVLESNQIFDDNLSFQNVEFLDETALENDSNSEKKLFSEDYSYFTNAHKITNNSQIKTEIDEIQFTQPTNEDSKQSQYDEKGKNKESRVTKINTKYSCRTLSEEEMLKYRESLKQSEPYASSKHKCEKCIKAFTKKHILDNHIEKYHDSTAGEHVCPICSVRKRTIATLDRHTSEHYTLYSCSDCPYRTCSRHHIYVHCESHSGEKLCTVCGYVAGSETLYRYHMERHKEKKLCCCDYCGKKMTKFALTNHIMKHMGMKGPVLRCEQCAYTTHSATSLNRHLSRRHAPRTPAPAVPEEAYCVECDAHFKNRLMLKNHLENTMRHAAQILPFKCPHCPTKLRSEKYVKSHIAEYHVPKKCEKCGYMSNSAHGYKRHLKTKHRDGEPPPNKYLCSICNKAFKMKRNKIEHEWSHSGYRPHKCAVCSDTFTHSASLYTHTKLKHKNKK